MYLSVRVDEEDVISELSDEALIKECQRRRINISGPVSSDRDKRNLLIDASDLCRLKGAPNIAFRLDEMREEIGL